MQLAKVPVHQLFPSHFIMVDKLVMLADSEEHVITLVQCAIGSLKLWRLPIKAQNFHTLAA